MYLNQEGIDRRYSQIILQELHEATEMTNDQINQAANELIRTTGSVIVPLRNQGNINRSAHNFHNV